MNFDEMQSVWRQQGYGGPAEATMRAALSDLESVARRHTRVTVIKLVAVAAIIILEAGWLVLRPGTPRSALFVAGAAWCLTTIVAASVLLWRARFSVSRLPIAEPTAAFIDRAVSTLEGQERTMRVHVLILMFALVAGLNLMLAGLRIDGWVSRSLNHGFASVAPLIGYLVGTRLRDRTLGAANRRLLERLGRARDAFAENSE